MEYFLSTASNLLAAAIVAGFLLLIIGVYSAHRLIDLIHGADTVIKRKWRSNINVALATRTTMNPHQRTVEQLATAADAVNANATKDDEVAAADDGTFVINDAGADEPSNTTVRIRLTSQTPNDLGDNGSGKNNRHRRQKKKRRNKQHQLAHSSATHGAGLNLHYDDEDGGGDDDEYCQEGPACCQMTSRQVTSTFEDQRDYDVNGDTFQAAAASSAIPSTGQSTTASALDDSRSQQGVDYMWSLADDDYYIEDRFWPEDATQTKSNASQSAQDDGGPGFELVASGDVSEDDCSLDNGNEADEADKSDGEIDRIGRRNREQQSPPGEKFEGPVDSAEGVEEETRRGNVATSIVDDRSLADEITFRLKRLVWLVDSVTADRHMFDRLPPLVAGTLQIITKEIDALSSAWSALRNQSASSALSNQQRQHVQRADCANEPESKESPGVMGPEPVPAIAGDAPPTIDDNDNSWVSLLRPNRHRRPHRPCHRRNAYGIWIPADEPLTEGVDEAGSADDDF